MTSRHSRTVDVHLGKVNSIIDFSLPYDCVIFLTLMMLLLQVLLKLLSIKTPITDADAIRALACRVGNFDKHSVCESIE